MFNMEGLPQDIVSKILSCVTGEFILSCKLVCKTWETLLRDRKAKAGLLLATALLDEEKATLSFGYYDDIMSDNHTVNCSFNTVTKRIKHPRVEMVEYDVLVIGSCSGLICLSVPNHGIGDPIYVCNPYTGEYANLPRLIIDGSHNTIGGHCYPNIVCGFGYLQRSNEYKVVRIYYPSYPGVGWVQIYTLGSCSGWRSIGEIKYSLCLSGVLSNEILYFMDARKQEIVALDLADEEFRPLSLPPSIQDGDYSNANSYVKLIGEQLCVVHEQYGNRVDIWSFKETEQKNIFTTGKDHNSWSWNLDYSIPWDFPDKNGSCMPFALTKGKEILLWYNAWTLVSYAPESATFKTIVDDRMTYDNFQAIPHRHSRVSLKALGVCSKMIGSIEEETPPQGLGPQGRCLEPKKKSAKGRLRLMCCFRPRTK
ncbi:hypothetical protein MKX03_027089 [Papaver bracteatum]|nr:hypothetical protein MKX03_027089 [Papaver bracteatum]